MEKDNAALAIRSDQEHAPVTPGFGSLQGFELIQRQAMLLSKSDLVPKEYRGNIANCIIGLEIASRLNASPLAILQNLYIVHGKPSWSSQFITAALNSTGKFSPVRFRIEGEGDKRSCTAWAVEKATGEVLEGPPVSIGMAKAEGWMDKAGSKWKTMPDLMLRYRAATFFGRLYAPEILMGMQTMEEVYDVVEMEQRTNGGGMEATTQSATEDLKKRISKVKKAAEPEPPPETDKIPCPDSDGESVYASFCESQCQKADSCQALEGHKL